ncbi:glycosyltransferase [Flavobacteriaceae bacterium 144Ye]|nr:glycosyltransferase [Flavobacteriaceae bacterium 144Ye]
MVNNIKVSIVCTAYNHEQFIAQAIDSFLEQQCDFAYEIIIHEDCSTDGTKAIIEAYEKKHPDIIKPIYQPVNIYSKGEKPWVYCFKKAKGDYIALCDGDDYWTDPLKLQKQVDVLEQHPQLNVCFTNRRVLSEGVLSSPPMPKDFIETPFSYKELLKHHNFIVTASVVFRKPEHFVIPDWFCQLPYGDMGLYKLLSTQDDFYGIADSTVVYRVHGSGIYSGVGKLTSRKLYYRFYKIIYPYLTREEQIVSKQKMLELTAEIGRLRFKGQPFKQRLYRIGFKMGLIT